MSGPAREGAICVDELCGQLNNTGHTTLIYAEEFQTEFVDATPVVARRDDFLKQEWWSQQNLDWAILYGGHSFEPQVLEAARFAGTKIVLELDCDGFVSPRQGLLRNLRLRIDPTISFRHQIRSWYAALKSWVCDGQRDRHLLATLAAADWIKIESKYPAEIFSQFLKRNGAANLLQKVVVIPFAVRKQFIDTKDLDGKEHLLIAAGRLGSHQKNPHAMKHVLSAVAKLVPDLRLELHLRGRSLELQSLVRLGSRVENISLHFDSPASVLAERLSKAKIMLSTSRWETTPVLGFEALCCGCSIVAPRCVPGYRSLIEASQFGSMFCSSRQAVDSIAAELKCWERGERRPTDVASRWRGQCSVPAVSKQLLSLMQQSR